MLFTTLLIAVLAASAVADPQDETLFDYCSIPCSRYGGRHLLCVPKAETSGDAGEEKSAGETQDDKNFHDLKTAISGCPGYQLGLSKEEKDLILELHNGMRSAVATGDLRQYLKNPDRFKQPTAANMVVMEWDDEMERIANERVKDCMSKTDDYCRQTKDGSEVGQNSDMCTMGIPEDGKDPRAVNIQSAVIKWFEGVMAFKTEWDLRAAAFRSSHELKGMYSQIVWAKTTHLACGYADKKDTEKGIYDAFMVCYYKPAGNIEYEDVYQEGSPGTACPANYIPTPAYPGLCQDKD